jgi:hypothetical protein
VGRHTLHFIDSRVGADTPDSAAATLAE